MQKQLLPLIPLCLLAGSAHAAPSARFTDLRHAYVRGETARLHLDLKEMPAGAQVRFDVSGRLEQAVPAAGAVTFALDTALLRAADYDVRAVVTADGREVARAEFPLSVVPEPNPQRYPVYRWGGIPVEDYPYWKARGFTGFTYVNSREVLAADSPAAQGIRRALDEAARQGLDFGCYLHPLLSQRWEKMPEVHALGADGKPLPQVYPREPQVLEYAERVAGAWADLFAEFPAWRHGLLSSEYQLFTNFSPLAQRLAREEAGVELPTAYVAGKLPAQHQPQEGLISDDNPHYRYMKWWYHQGMGDAVLNERMATRVRAKRPDVLLWHDPYRLAPVFGSHKGMDAVSTWTYAHPDMRRLLYTTVLQAAARPEKQKVMQTVTLFLYGRFAVPLGDSTAVLGNDQPGKDPYYTAGPDFAREATWLAFSQRPDLLGYYAAGALSPYLRGLDPDIASPETYDAIGEVVRSLVEPYGPMVLQSRRPRAKVAVLMSAASTWFPSGSRLVGYPNEQILPYCSLLAMNHVPFEVVLDDDVVQGRLAEYSALVMPRASTLTRKMHAEILKFRDRGGKVIADATLRAKLPGAIVTNYDFSHQTRVDGKALAEKRAVTAVEDRRLTEGYAADLKKHLTGLEGLATAASPRVVVNTLECGAAKAVFLVNDNRTYGPRFGQYGLHMESGVRLDTEARIRVEGSPVIYDSLAGKEVAYRLDGNLAVFPVSLPAARGKLLLVYPEAVGTVRVEAPADLTPGKVAPIRVRVLGKSGKPLAVPHPLKVEITDALGRLNEHSRTVACQNGEYALSFRPALNDARGTWTVRVTDLVTGRVTSATFQR